MQNLVGVDTEDQVVVMMKCDGWFSPPVPHNFSHAHK